MIEQLLNEKSIKAKEKVTQLSAAFSVNSSLIDEAIELVSNKKDLDKANVMEAIEQVTKVNSNLANELILHFALQGLESKTPRLMWESARVIGNSCKLFPHHLSLISEQLMKYSAYEGTVVRWSIAYALGEIILLKSNLNKSLIEKAQEIADKEEKNSIKKIYQAAIKKVNKS